MSIGSVIIAYFRRELFGVVVIALNVKMKVLGSNPYVRIVYSSEELCTVL
jgi:hypothetical protein